MLSRLMLKLRTRWRRIVRPNVIKVVGVRVHVGDADLPVKIRKDLIREIYEADECRIVNQYLTSADRVLDIGAGIGFISLQCAKICGPESVLSYEANPQMRGVIERNFKLNGMTPNLRTRVLSDKEGEVSFFLSDNIISSSLIDRKTSENTILQADAIDKVVGEHRPTAIVIDVEGAETTLLRRCDLSGVQKILAELHPHIVGDSAIEELLDYLRTKGFAIVEKSGKTVLLQHS